MSVLLKERNKILFQIKAMNSVLEQGEGEMGPVISFLLIKNISNMIERLKSDLEQNNDSTLFNKSTVDSFK